MTKVQYYVASSVDGFIATPDDSLDWLLQFGFDDFQESYDTFLADVGCVVMGSVTYEWLVREVGDDWSYPTLPSIVVTTRSLDAHPGGDIRFMAGSPAEVAAAARDAAGTKNVWIVGGGGLAAQLADAGLLDELILTVVPVVLGTGKPLLPLASPTARLAVTGATTFDNGALAATYALR